MVKFEDIQRPFNPGFAAVSVKTVIEKIKTEYAEYVEKDMKVSAMKVKDDYYIYFNYPSKANKKYPDDRIVYDIVFQFIPPNSNHKKLELIENYDLRVFSNVPSFMFTFTYVYNHRHALIKLPLKYYSKKALKERPKVRNPMMLLGIDEGLYHCAMYIRSHHLLEKQFLHKLIENSSLDMSLLLKTIASQEEKLKESSDRDLRHRAAKKREHSKVWDDNNAKGKAKKALLEEAKNLKSESAPSQEGKERLKSALNQNMKAQMAIDNKPVLKNKGFLKFSPKFSMKLPKWGGLKANMKAKM